ncbi:PP2C family protein-serine/threonine phosphatase [Hydrogenophaga sp.]|jgi:serine/threonine protein phosphatase PrpC|uniref:PP2C family protein-serine/threonine phosphatase n=1 Tax=Hydrogenophaga sp. TaxID=1904254 RepID=UPI00391A250A
MAKGFRIQASTGIHRGDRDYQQDQVNLLSHARHKGCLLAVLADGMGGRSGGRKASDQVMMTAKQLFDRFDPDTDDPVSLLKRIVEEAHIVIKLTAVSAEQEPHSTIAAFIVMPSGESHWAHAGDSRIYHFHQGKLVKRTLDHSYVQSLINQGELTEQQALDHPHANILMGCLGTENDPPVDLHMVPKLEAGDTLLACSDGLWHYFSPEELASTVAMLTPREACEFLIQKARTRARGAGDNLSLVIVKFDPIL